MKREFDEFMSSRQSPPIELSQKVMAHVEGDLAPSLSQALPRFVSVYFASGLLTLSICPQFGIGPLGGGHGIAHYFMEVGLWACALFCGSFFLGVGALTSSLFLTKPELAVLRKSSIWLVPTLSAFTLVILMIAGYMIGGYSEFLTPSYVVFWTVGAILTGRLVFALLSWAPRERGAFR